MLPLHRAGDREVRPAPRQLDGCAAHRPLPSLATPAATTPSDDARERPPRDPPRARVLARSAPILLLVADRARSSPRARRWAATPSGAADGADADAAARPPLVSRPSPGADPVEPPGVAVHADLPGSCSSCSCLRPASTGRTSCIAIILTTLVVRTALIPLMRRQMVSMRRMQLLAARDQGDPAQVQGRPVKQQQATMALYKERGISQAAAAWRPAARCLLICRCTGRQRGPDGSDLSAMLHGLRHPARSRIDVPDGARCSTPPAT